MVNDLNKLVEKEGKQEYFRYITLDTNGADLDDESPEKANITKIKLQKPARYWVRDRQEFFYLDESLELETEEGTGQKRPVSRYHLDSGQFRSYVDRIESAIDGFERDIQKKEDADASIFYVWVLNSFGGGTGSGAFPLVGTLLRDVLDSDRYVVNGIGSLPRVDDLERERFDPEGQNQLYVNSYTALEELKSMVNYDHREDYEAPPVRIESGGTTTGMELKPKTRFGQSDPTFNKYWLVGYDEEEPFEAYRNRMNRIATNAVFYFAHKDQPEDFPYHDSVADETLMGISSVELSIQAERANRFLEKRDEIDRLETEIEEIESDIDDLGTAKDYLDAVLELTLSIDGEEGGSQERDGPVAEDLISGAKDARTDAFDPSTDLEEITISNYNADRGEVKDELDEILERAHDELDAYVRTPDELDTGETEYDATDVINKFYCKILYQTIENDELSSHEFKDVVDEIWSEYEAKIKDEYPNKFDAMENGTARGRWTMALAEFLPEYKRQQQEIADGTLRPVKKALAKRRSKNAEEAYERAKPLFDNYERLRTLKKLADETYRGADDNLSTDLATLRDVRSRKRNARREKNSDLGDAQEKLREYREKLRAGQRKEGKYQPPMENLDRLDYDDLHRVVSIGALIDESVVTEEAARDVLVDEPSEEDENSSESTDVDVHGMEVNIHELEERGLIDDSHKAKITEEMVTHPSIAHLIDKGILQREDIGRDMEALLESGFLTRDPIQDIRENPPRDVTPNAIVGFLMSDDNADPEGPAGNLMQLESDEGEFDIQDTLSAVADGTIDDPSPMGDGLSIRFITWFAPVALENTSEYGTMYRYYIEEDNDINQHLSTLTDEDVTRSFGYPELVEDEEVLRRLGDIDRLPPGHAPATEPVEEEEE